MFARPAARPLFPPHKPIFRLLHTKESSCHSSKHPRFPFYHRTRGSRHALLSSLHPSARGEWEGARRGGGAHDTVPRDADSRQGAAHGGRLATSALLHSRGRRHFAACVEACWQARRGACGQRFPSPFPMQASFRSRFTTLQNAPRHRVRHGELGWVTTRSTPVEAGEGREGRRGVGRSHKTHVSQNQPTPLFSHHPTARPRAGHRPGCHHHHHHSLL